MIYSYKFEKDFFTALSKIDYHEIVEVINFFKDFILKKENLFFFDTRNDFFKKNKIEPNTNEIKILIELFKNEILPINKLHDKKIDFIFSEKSKLSDNINTIQRKIGIDEIIHARSEIEKEIENFAISEWYPIKIKNQLKKDLKNFKEQNLKNEVEKLKSLNLKKILKRLFRYSDKVYFVDAFLPDHIMGSNLKSFQKSFKFFKDLTINVKTVEFYHGIRNTHINSIKAKIPNCNPKKDEKIYNEKIRKEIEISLKNFFKEFKLFKSDVYVKHREAVDEYGMRDVKQFEAYDKALYDRMIITFLDSKNIAIIEVKKGLNIIKHNDTIEDRNLSKKSKEWSQSKMDNEWIYVENSGNFLHFNTSSIK